jgi:hypothetical protein
MLGLRNFIRRLRSLQAGDEEDVRRGADNVDAMAAGGGRARGDSTTGVGLGPSVPPNYIKTYDEGRPRK